MKLLIKLLALVIFGAVALGTAGYFLIPPAAKTAVSEGTEYALGVESSLDSIKASPGLTSTSLGFEGFSLDSPTGYTDKLLTVGKFNVGVGTKSIIGDTKDVGAFILEDVQLTLVQDGMQNNFVPILRHLQGLGGSDDGKTVDGDERTGAPGPKLRIGTIKVSGISARVKLTGIPGLEALDQTFEVPAYEKDLSEITGTEGKTVAEISALFVQDLKDQAMTAAEGYVPEGYMPFVTKALEGGFEGGVDGAIGAAKGFAEDAGKQKLDELKKDGESKVDEGVEKAEKAIEDLGKDAKSKLKKGIGGFLNGKKDGE